MEESERSSAGEAHAHAMRAAEAAAAGDVSFPQTAFRLTQLFPQPLPADKDGPARAYLCSTLFSR